MIHRTSPLLLRLATLPSRSVSLFTSSYVPAPAFCLCLALPCHAMPCHALPCPAAAVCPSVARIDSRALTISPRAIHDRFACRLVFSRHVSRSLPSISCVLLLARRALRGSVVVESVLPDDGPRRILLQRWILAGGYVRVTYPARGKRRLLFQV